MIHHDKGLLQAGPLRLRSEPLTETVYRYRQMNHWLRPILTDDELYFPTPDQCNDPFDCRFELDREMPIAGLVKLLEEERVVAQLAQKIGNAHKTRLASSVVPETPIADMTDDQLRSYAERIYETHDLGDQEMQESVKARVESARERIGVCCFAGRGDDMLMFAHYAAQHTGCCLEFQIRDDSGHRDSIFEEPGLQFRDVEYTEVAPVVPIYEMGTLRSLMKVTLTKHPRWTYEAEVRVIRFKGPGPVRFKRESLTGVIFGYRASEEDIGRALKWLGPRRGVSLSRAVPNKKNSLELVPFTAW